MLSVFADCFPGRDVNLDWGRHDWKFTPQQQQQQPWHNLTCGKHCPKFFVVVVIVFLFVFLAVLGSM